MSTVAPIHPGPAAQPLQALTLANAARIAGAEVKRDVKAGVLSVADALEDERAQSVRVHELVVAQPGWGKVRARRLLMASHIAEGRKVRELTVRQRELVADACR